MLAVVGILIAGVTGYMTYKETRRQTYKEVWEYTQSCKMNNEFLEVYLDRDMYRIKCVPRFEARISPGVVMP